MPDPVIKGHRICAEYGGQLPSVKAAAQRRLLEAADPVVLDRALGHFASAVRY